MRLIYSHYAVSIKHYIYTLFLFIICFSIFGCNRLLRSNSENTSNIQCNHKQSTSNNHKGLPPDFEAIFFIPDVSTDQYGNPVVSRNESRFDPTTGYALEIWLKIPRIEFVLIPAGQFTMGASNLNTHSMPSEKPAHVVRLSKPFYIGKYEITQLQWSAVMNNLPSFFQLAGIFAPVEDVSWHDCQSYIDTVNSLYRSVKDKSSDLIFRLPSESEWEYSCRAGTLTPIYSGQLTILGECNGPELDLIAWYSGNSGIKCIPPEYFLDLDFPARGRWRAISSSNWKEKQYKHSYAGIHRVGQKKPNNWGLYDMLGNVREFCEDNWYDNYEKGPFNESPVKNTSDDRVVRGGGWCSYARLCQASHRSRVSSSGTRSYDVGFRLCISIK